jgi:hypothetical protein
MSLLKNQSHAENQSPLWLSVNASGQVGPQGPTGPAGPPGSSTGIIYYFNESQNSDIAGYKVISTTPVFNPGIQVAVAGAGNQLIGEYATPLGNPNVSLVPTGFWVFTGYIQTTGGTPYVFAEVYVRTDLGVETLIGTSVQRDVTTLASTLYTFGCSINSYGLALTDRIVIKLYAGNLGADTLTYHFEGNEVGQVVTSFSSTAPPLLWAEYPAVDNVDMNNQDINNVGEVNANDLVRVGPIALGNDGRIRIGNVEPREFVANALGQVRARGNGWFQSLGVGGPNENNPTLTINNAGLLNSQNQLHANVITAVGVPNNAAFEVDGNEVKISGIRFRFESPNLVQYNDFVVNGNFKMNAGPNFPVNFPSFQCFPSSANFGNLANPVNNFSVAALNGATFNGGGFFTANMGGAINLTAGVGMNLTAGANINLNTLGVMNLTSAGAVNITGIGSVNLAGLGINMFGGALNMGAGIINTGGGLINTGGGNILIGSGLMEMGTPISSGGNLLMYGNRMVMNSVGGNITGIDVNGTGNIKTNTLTSGNLNFLNITTNSPGTNQINLTGVGNITSFGAGMNLSNVLSVQGNASTGCPLTNISTINGRPLFINGSFQSSNTQSVAGANIVTLITYDVTNVANGVSLGSPTSQIIVSQTGLYEFNYSLQLDKSGGGTARVDIWLRKNGVNVPDSASQVVVAGTNGETLPFVNYYLQLNAGDYIELAFASSDASVIALSEPAITTPYVRPAVPSIIANIRLIST